MARIVNKVIKIVFSTSSAYSKTYEEFEDEEQGTNRTSEKREEAKKDAAKAILIRKIVDEVSSDIERLAENAGNRYFNLSEDYMAENQMNIINANIDRGKKLAGDIYVGADFGAKVGGPLGAIVGSIIGTVKWGADTAIETRNRKSQWYSALNATNAQTEFSAARYGFIDGGRGTEN